MQYDKEKGIKRFLCLVLYKDTPFQEKKNLSFPIAVEAATQ